MRTFIVCLLAALAAQVAVAADVVNVDKSQPAVVTDQAFADEHVNLRWSNAIRMSGMEKFIPLVPTYKNEGKLFASWNPLPSDQIGMRPTFIVIHGGHGVVPNNMENAMQLRNMFNANILVLDSYVSRGKTENWLTWNRYGANMRMLDAIAAARFTKSRGTDPAKTFLIGDSQGGWTTLRTMTEGHDHAGEVASLFRGGIALYPNCYAKNSWYGKAPNGETNGEYAPPLGPYKMPLIVFTGTSDTATPTNQCDVDRALKSAEQWFNFEGATHAFDMPSGGVGRKAVDGVCSKAANIYNHFEMCRSDKYTGIMFDTIQKFVTKYAGADAVMAWKRPEPEQTFTVPQHAPTTDRAEIERRYVEIMKQMEIK